MNRTIAIALASAFFFSAYPAYADGDEQKKEGESQLVAQEDGDKKKEGEGGDGGLYLAQEDGDKKKEGEGGDGGLYLAQEDGDKKKEGEGGGDGGLRS